VLKPILFLLRPGFEDPALGPGKFICPPCTAVEGLLSVFPELRDEVEVRHVEFPRPRTDIIELIGEANQGCPVLVVSSDEFYTGDAAIAECFADRFGIPRYH
jgi:hypothetical protein